MGRKTDALLRGFRAAKCLTLLKLTTSRIKVVRNKRSVSASQLRKEIAQLIKSGHEAHVYITKADVLIKEENLIAAYDLIDQFCHLIISRFPIIETQKAIPLDMKEPIASLIYAAPRCTELGELGPIKDMFTGKYGKEFAVAAAELRPDCGVNRLLIEKLTVRPATGQMKLKLMKDICVENKIDWTPGNAYADQPNSSQEEQQKCGIKFQAGEVKTLSVNDPGPSKTNVINQSQVTSKNKVDDDYKLPVNRPPEAGKVNIPASTVSIPAPHSEEKTSYEYQRKASASQPESQHKVSEYGSEAVVDDTADSCSDSYLSVEEEMSEDEKHVSKLESSQSKSRVEPLRDSKSARTISGKVYDEKSSSKQQELQDHSSTLQRRQDISPLKTEEHQEEEPVNYQTNVTSSQDNQLTSSSFGFKDEETSRFQIKDHSSTSLRRREDITSPKTEVHEESGNYQMNDIHSEKGQFNLASFGVRDEERARFENMWQNSAASSVSTNATNLKSSHSVIEDSNDGSESTSEAVQKTEESIPDDFAATAKAIAAEAARLALLEYAKKHGISSPIYVNLDDISKYGQLPDSIMNVEVLANLENVESASSPVKMHGDDDEDVNVFSIADKSENPGEDSGDEYVWDVKDESEVESEENCNPFAKESGESSVEGAVLSSWNRENDAANWNDVKPSQPEDDYLNSIFARRSNWAMDDSPKFDDNWDRYTTTRPKFRDSYGNGRFGYDIQEEVPKRHIFNNVFSNEEMKPQELKHITDSLSSMVPQFDEIPYGETMSLEEVSNVKVGGQQLDDVLNDEPKLSQGTSISKKDGAFDEPEKAIYDDEPDSYDTYDSDPEEQLSLQVKLWDSIRTTKSQNVYDHTQDEDISKQVVIRRSRKDYKKYDDDNVQLQPVISTRTSSIHSRKTQEVHEYASDQYQYDCTDNTQGKSLFRAEESDRYAIETTEPRPTKADPKAGHYERKEFEEVVETEFDDYEGIFESKSPVSYVQSKDKEEHHSKLPSDRAPSPHHLSSVNNLSNKPADSNRADYKEKVDELSSVPAEPKSRRTRKSSASRITIHDDYNHGKDSSVDYGAISSDILKPGRLSRKQGTDYTDGEISETSSVSNVNLASKDDLVEEGEEPKIMSRKQANQYVEPNEDISVDPSGADSTRKKNARSPVHYQTTTSDEIDPFGRKTLVSDSEMLETEAKWGIASETSISASERRKQEMEKQHYPRNDSVQTKLDRTRLYMPMHTYDSSLQTGKEDQKAKHQESKFQDLSTSRLLSNAAQRQKHQKDVGENSSPSAYKAVVKNNSNEIIPSSISDPLILATMAPPSRSSAQRQKHQKDVDENSSPSAYKAVVKNDSSEIIQASISDPLILATMAPPSRSSSKRSASNKTKEATNITEEIEKTSLSHGESISDPMILATMPPPSKSLSKRSSSHSAGTKVSAGPLGTTKESTASVISTHKESISTASVSSTSKDSVLVSSKLTSATSATPLVISASIANSTSMSSNEATPNSTPVSSTSDNKPMFPDIETLEANFEAFRRKRLGLGQGK